MSLVQFIWYHIYCFTAENEARLLLKSRILCYCHLLILVFVHFMRRVSGDYYWCFHIL